VERSVRAFAPATVANLGVGFDWLGCAVGEKVPVKGCRPRCSSTA